MAENAASPARETRVCRRDAFHFLSFIIRLHVLLSYNIESKLNINSPVIAKVNIDLNQMIIKLSDIFTLFHHCFHQNHVII